MSSGSLKASQELLDIGHDLQAHLETGSSVPPPLLCSHCFLSYTMFIAHCFVFFLVTPYFSPAVRGSQKVRFSVHNLESMVYALILKSLRRE